MTTVSLNFFLNFAASINDPALSTQEVIKDLIRPQTAAKKVKYTEYINPSFVGGAVAVKSKRKTFHVIHSSSALFQDLFAAIRRFFRDDYDEGFDRENIFLLLDIFYVNHHKPEDRLSPSALSDQIKSCDLSLLVLDSSGLVFNDPLSLAENLLSLVLHKKLQVLARGTDVLALKNNFASLQLELPDMSNSQELNDPAYAITRHALQLQAPMDLMSASEFIKSSIVKSSVDEIKVFESKSQPLRDDEGYYRLLLKAAQLAGLAGSYAEAMPLMDSAMKLCSTVYGDEDEEMAICHHSLASLYKLQGRLPRAEVHQRLALSILESVVSGPRGLDDEERVSPNPFATANVNQPPHPQAGKITLYLADLGRIRRGQGKYVEAEGDFRQALSIKDAEAEKRIKAGNGCTSRYEEDDEEAIKITHDLAAVCLDQGKNEEAIILHMRSIKAMQFKVKQKPLVGSKKNPALAQYLMKLAKQWLENKGFVEACDLFEEAAFEASKSSGSLHPLTLTCIAYQADALRQMKKISDAVILARKAYEGRIKALGPEHQSTIESLDQLIFMLLELKAFDEAEPLMKKALAHLEMLASRNPSNSLLAKVASRQHGVARLLDAKSQKTGSRAEETEALDLYSRALALRNRIMGSDHRDSLSTLFFLASLEARVALRSTEQGSISSIRMGSLARAAGLYETLADSLLHKAESQGEFAAVIKEESNAKDGVTQLIRVLNGLASVLSLLNQVDRFKVLLSSIDRALALKKGQKDQEALLQLRLSVSSNLEKASKALTNQPSSKKVAKASAPIGFLSGVERVKQVPEKISTFKFREPIVAANNAYNSWPRPDLAAEKSQGHLSTSPPPFQPYSHLSGPSPMSILKPLSSFSDPFRPRRISMPSLQQESSTSSLEADTLDRFSHGHSFPPTSPSRASGQSVSLPPIANPPSLKRRDTRSMSNDRQDRHSATRPIQAATGLAPFEFVKAFIPMSTRD